jgi:hypothetical protein
MVDPAAIRRAMKDVINNNTILSMAARNFGISKTTTTISRYLLKFQEQDTPTDFEYTARNDVKKIFSAAQEFELAEYFKQAAKLRYGLTKKEAVKLAFKPLGMAKKMMWLCHRVG